MGKVRFIYIFTLIILAVTFLNVCSEKRDPINPYNSNYDPEKWMPQNLKLEEKNIHSVELSWEQVEENIDGFMIDKEVGNGDIMVGIDTLDRRKRDYTDTSAVPTKKNTYWVYAFADENKSKAISEEITIEFPHPTDLDAEQESLTEIRLSWKDNSDGEDGFKIDRKGENGNWIESYAVKDPEAETWTDTSVYVNNKYTYRIYAYKGEEISEQIDTIVTVEFPPPSNLELEQLSTTEIQLDWDYNSIGEDGFIIDRQMKNNDWVELDRVNKEIKTFIDNDLIYGESYTYRIKAYIADYESESSNIPGYLKMIIPAPGNLQAQIINYESVNLTWTDNCNFENGYKVERKEDTQSYENIAELAANTISFTDNTVLQNTEYIYRVCAYTNNHQSEIIESDKISTKIYPPVAYFTVTPDSGDINTTFEFDASQSNDKEDDISELMVRWDWQNDGNWDTDFSEQKIATHQYSSIGKYIANLEVKDTHGLISDTTRIISVFKLNTPPVASFVVNPESGDINTTFEFDASQSSDKEDGISELMVRWDWQNDDNWDTDFSTTKIASHKFNSEGTYVIKLEVKDSKGLTDNTTKSINVTSSLIGNIKWEFETAGRIRSSPAIGQDGTIYVGSYDKKMYAINPDGTKKWEFKTEHYIDNSSPAISSDGTIYIGDAIYGAGNLYAINPDGTKKWEFKTSGRIQSSPAIGYDGTIYVGSNDNKLYAINPNSNKKWEFLTGGYVTSSPAIGSDGTIYVGSSDNKLYAINPNGNKKWEFYTNGRIESSPAIDSDGTIYIGSHDSRVYAINPDGSEKWELEIGDWIHSSPAIGQDRTIYIGSYDNNIYALNPDGTEKWKFETGDIIKSCPAIGSNGIVCIGTNNDRLYAINSDGMKNWEFYSGKYADIASSPVIGFDGTIYIGTDTNKIFAIYGNSSGLADSPWPMFHKNLRHTGRVEYIYTNMPPTALFTISPESGDVDTEFTFDASVSKDEEDDISDLLVRWDWENDNNWDTDFSTTKTENHKFQNKGNYSIKLEAMDTGGLTSTTKNTVIVGLPNTTPIASFTVQPDTGNINTNFNFDASASNDNEDNTSDLQVRWDFENDGTWDSNYSTTKTTTHQYSSTGTYDVKLEVKDTDGAVDDTTISVNVGNTSPTASFTVSPESGNINTEFSIDASGSSDTEDSISDLQVRWDFENDGTWDTNYSTTKTTTHQYSSTGTYDINLEVKDTDGAVDDTTISVNVGNTSPQASFTVSPESGDISTEFTFDASGCNDAEDDNSDLQVRWDWENDGIWDTNYSTAKTANHQFTSSGEYEVKLEVIDSHGLKDFYLKQIVVEISDKVFGTSDDETAYSIRQTYEGGYILAGYRSSNEIGDFLLIKADNSGNKEWEKIYGGSKNDKARAVRQTNDGGFIITGSTESYGSGGKDIWLIKTDANGNLQWDKTFGGASSDMGYDIQETSDGGYIIAGQTQSFESILSDYWLIKTDANGNKEWDQIIGSNEYDQAKSVQQTTDGGYIIAGYNGNIWLVKTSQNGNKEWDKTFGGSESDRAFSIRQTNDGGYILSGPTASYDATYYQALLIKLDTNGNQEWLETYGEIGKLDISWSMEICQDRGYIMGGYTNNESSDYLLIKTDSEGNQKWKKSYGQSGDDMGWSVQNTSDNGYVFTGWSKSFGLGGTDIWLIKVDSQGNRVF